MGPGQYRDLNFCPGLNHNFGWDFGRDFRKKIVLKSHTTSEINKSLEDNLVNNSSIYFLNIDGNKSNFNNLSVEIARFSKQFSFIGLAETYVGSDAVSFLYI